MKPPKRKRRAPTLPALKRKAWGLLSQCIRQEANAGPGDAIQCYTCDYIACASQMQAGHAIPGRTGSTLLDEEIIRPQCPRCNIWGRGTYHVFTAKLIRENGLDWWERKLTESRQVKKWNRAELEEKIASYKARLEALS